MTHNRHGDRRDVDLSSATRLELGLSALEPGNIPAAVGALAAIPAAEWNAILDRFPSLPAYVHREMNR